MTIRNVPSEIWLFALIGTLLTVIAILWILLGRARDESDGFTLLILESAEREACVTCFEKEQWVRTYADHLPHPGTDHKDHIIIPPTDHEYVPGVLVRLTTDVEDQVWPMQTLTSNGKVKPYRASSVDTRRRSTRNRIP